MPGELATGCSRSYELAHEGAWEARLRIEDSGPGDDESRSSFSGLRPIAAPTSTRLFASEAAASSLPNAIRLRHDSDPPPRLRENLESPIPGRSSKRPARTDEVTAFGRESGRS